MTRDEIRERELAALLKAVRGVPNYETDWTADRRAKLERSVTAAFGIGWLAHEMALSDETDKRKGAEAPSRKG